MVHFHAKKRNILCGLLLRKMFHKFGLHTADQQEKTFPNKSL
jgi:hypothetical protein